MFYAIFVHNTDVHNYNIGQSANVHNPIVGNHLKGRSANKGFNTPHIYFSAMESAELMACLADT